MSSCHFQQVVANTFAMRAYRMCLMNFKAELGKFGPPFDCRGSVTSELVDATSGKVPNNHDRLLIHRLYLSNAPAGEEVRG